MDRRVLTVWLLGTLPLLRAQRVGVPTEELTSLNVDELFQVQVTSVGRKAQQLSRAPAAVYVLTADDIRRSGATSVPEALQWVPGLTVLSVDGRAWAISARGSTRLYADKILVMVDGRSLYTPLFSGVMWDFIDVPLENIEQIEVIRGPGSVMWGPNAVNGVINIITRKAKEKRSTEVAVSAGTDLQGAALVSWNSTLGDRLAVRLWSKVEDFDPAWSSPGGYLFKGTHQYRIDTPVDSLESRTVSTGVRLDLRPSSKDELMVQADMRGSAREEVLGYPANDGMLDAEQARTESQSASLQLRWTKTLSAGNERTLQFTFDKQRLNFPFFHFHVNNLAVDYQWRHQAGEQNEIYLGAAISSIGTKPLLEGSSASSPRLPPTA